MQFPTRTCVKLALSISRTGEWCSAPSCVDCFWTRSVSGAGKLYTVSHLSLLKLQLFLPIIHRPSWKSSAFRKSEQLSSHCRFFFHLFLGLLLESAESIPKEQTTCRKKDLDFQGKQDFWNVTRAGALQFLQAECQSC